jgi:hypothetical protein
MEPSKQTSCFLSTHWLALQVSLPSGTESLIKQKHLIMYASRFGWDAWVMDILVKCTHVLDSLRHVYYTILYYTIYILYILYYTILYCILYIVDFFIVAFMFDLYYFRNPQTTVYIVLSWYNLPFNVICTAILNNITVYKCIYIYIYIYIYIIHYYS